MRKFIAGVLFALFCLTAMGESSFDKAETRAETGDLKEAVSVFVKNMAKEGSDGFRPAMPAEQKTWRAAIEAILNGDLSRARGRLKELPYAFEIVRFKDAATEREYLILRENAASPAGWGFYVFDLETKSDLVIEIPHPAADARTEQQGVDAFRQARAAVLMIAGTHRRASLAQSECNQPGLCSRNAENGEGARYPISDAAHSVVTVFQTTHETIADARPRSVAVQLHGMIARDSCPNAFLSTGTAKVTTNAERLLSCLSKHRVEAEIWRGGCDGCPLIATTNTQGRYSNGERGAPCTKNPETSPEPGRFIHIEQEPNLRRSPESWQPVVEALKCAFPAD